MPAQPGLCQTRSETPKTSFLTTRLKYLLTILFIFSVTGSPFQFHVDAVDSGFVTAYGTGLSHGVANEPAEFTIVTKDAGAGGCSLFAVDACHKKIK